MRCETSSGTESFLTALPVYNEAASVHAVLNEVVQYSRDVLVVDDGSDDGTSDILSRRNDIRVLAHPENQGYGAALVSAFQYAAAQRFDYVVTIDCDGQHQPQRIPQFVDACKSADIVSGSRYLETFPGDVAPPEQRRMINRQVTAELNDRLGLQITDAFCGFKAYRVKPLSRLQLTETGYAMPLELWVQATKAKLKIVELPVPRIYLDEKRSFGGVLDDSATRMAYYREVIDRSMIAARIRQSGVAARVLWGTSLMDRGFELPSLRVPREDCSTLVYPPLSASPALLKRNARLRADYARVEVSGQTLLQVSDRARAALLASAKQYTLAYRGWREPSGGQPLGRPFILTGHQPQLFHAGVWFKNFVLDALVQSSDAVGIHLLIDNDLARLPSIRVPIDTLAKPTSHSVPYDAATDAVPFEERAVADREIFGSFAKRIQQAIAPAGGKPADPIDVA